MEYENHFADAIIDSVKSGFMDDLGPAVMREENEPMELGPVTPVFCAHCGEDPMTHVHYRGGGMNTTLCTMPLSPEPVRRDAISGGLFDRPNTKPSVSDKARYWELRHQYERTGDKAVLEEALAIVPREMPDDWAVDPRDAGKVASPAPWPFSTWIGFWTVMAPLFIAGFGALIIVLGVTTL